MVEELRRQELMAEYAEVNQNFRMLADVRFRLLALIPTFGGIAIFLLSRMQQPEPKLGFGLLFLISGLGFLATLGVTLYDQRNNEFYGALIERARYLERQLQLPRRRPGAKTGDAGTCGGQFVERPERGELDRYLFKTIQLGHDPGLALIYGAVLGAWFYPLTSAFLGLTLGPVGLDPEVRQGVSLLFALIMVWLFVRELLRLDDPKIKGRFPNLFPGFFKPRNPENTHSQNTTREQPGEQQPGEQRRRG